MEQTHDWDRSSIHTEKKHNESLFWHLGAQFRSYQIHQEAGSESNELKPRSTSSETLNLRAVQKNETGACEEVFDDTTEQHYDEEPDVNAVATESDSQTIARQEATAYGTFTVKLCGCACHHWSVDNAQAELQSEVFLATPGPWNALHLSNVSPLLLRRADNDLPFIQDCKCICYDMTIEWAEVEAPDEDISNNDGT